MPTGRDISRCRMMLMPSHFHPLGSPSRAGRQVHLYSELRLLAVNSLPVNCRSWAFDPSLITQNINDDTAIGCALPDLALLPVTALDLTLHGLDGVSGEQIRQRKQHISRRAHDDGRLGGAGSS